MTVWFGLTALALIFVAIDIRRTPAHPVLKWAFFQAFAMREMAGSYRRALRDTFYPELVSMNLLMAGIVTTMRLLRPRLAGAGDPLDPSFWFVMSMALVGGFLIAYPMNWWLVARGLKHGMITVRRNTEGGSRRGLSRRVTGNGEPEVHSTASHPDSKLPNPIETLVVLGSSLSILAAALLIGT